MKKGFGGTRVILSLFTNSVVVTLQHNGGWEIMDVTWENILKCFCCNVQVKGSDTSYLLPSTSMAAHAVDDLIEAIEEEKLETVNAATTLVNGKTDDKVGLPCLPPPPPIPQNAYNQVQSFATTRFLIL